MEVYQEKELLRLAGRYQNSKRQFLLVNPLQGKHIPVSPGKSLAMMKTLGEKLYNAVPDAKCIIGFAETATAIGAAAACVFPDDVFYIHTTREAFPDENALLFSEEHSHASEQKINTIKLSGVKSGSMILIDDEISTGKTMENILDALNKNMPSLLSDGCCIGSVINRVPENRLDAFRSRGTEFVFLLRPEKDNFEYEASGFSVSSPKEINTYDALPFRMLLPVHEIPDMRCGAMVGEIRESIRIFTEEVCGVLKKELSDYRKILILGTEECMFPALCIGDALERQKENFSVFCHAATRSPIGICLEPEYPIRNGVQLESFYEDGRKTFLYNLQPYDAVVVVTDSRNEKQICRAMESLTAAFSGLCSNFYCVKVKI